MAPAHQSPRRHCGLHRVRHQRGAAALIVVMVLFFIMSMVAAYLSRNLIFEQKTSANQYRATLAFEAAEAGLEWTLAQLNGGRIGAQCLSSVTPGDTSFRDRYLATDATTGEFVVQRWDNGGTLTNLQAGCVRSGAGWACSCPTNGEPAPALPGGGGLAPAFWVAFNTVGGQPGTLRLTSYGCTSHDVTCLRQDSGGIGTATESAAAVGIVVSLAHGLATPPAAALTVRNTLNTAAALLVNNTDAATNGITLNVGGNINAPAAVLTTVPGADPAASALGSDTSLSSMSADQMFVSTFGMARNTYKRQPAVVQVTDCATTCSAKLTQAVANNPGRMVWVEGDLNIESNVTLGAASDPVILVVNGNINFATNGSKVYGLVYSQAATWANAGASGFIQGAAVAEGDFAGTAPLVVSYDPAILSLLSMRQGSLVRVPGSWKD